MGFNDPFRKIISSSCFFPPEMGNVLRRSCRSRSTSVADWPAPMTAICKGAEGLHREEKKASADEMYEALWITRG